VSFDFSIGWIIALTVNPAVVTSDNPGQEGYIVAVPLPDPSRNRMRPDTKNKQTPWSESASELNRPSDRRLSGK
jgi:hypothetical protein